VARAPPCTYIPCTCMLHTGPRAPSSRARAFQAIPMTKFKTSRRRSDSSAGSPLSPAVESKLARRGRGGERVFGVVGPGGRELIQETLLAATPRSRLPAAAGRTEGEGWGWGERSEFPLPPALPSLPLTHPRHVRAPALREFSEFFYRAEENPRV